MLKRIFMPLLAVCAISVSSMAVAAGETYVKLVTSAGDIELELNDKKAPVTTDNFMQYVNEGYYNGTTFHRVIPGFMIQGGGFNKELQQKQTELRLKMRPIMVCVICVEPLLWRELPVKIVLPANFLSILRIMPS